MIGNGQARAKGSFFSKYHGLVINDEMSYNNYIVSLMKNVNLHI